MSKVAGYFNFMERVRKRAGFPELAGGVPPKTHRKCADWAKFVSAVESVANELTADLMSCKDSYSRLADTAASHAGKVAEMSETISDIKMEAVKRGISVAALEGDLTPDTRTKLIEATVT